MSPRIGIGYDIHRLEDRPGAGLVLAGVLVPCDLASVAHSDGDVVLHALTDAILGALAAGDIGELFPDTDPANAERDSTDFLAHALALATARGYRPGNCDINIIAQRPRLAAHKPAMRTALATFLDLPPDAVGLKARTKERCDATGAGTAIEAQAAILLLHR
ncbi:MAG: 2-C-methyl-D-erythritol 2,4-cyclodiphosphate synthase [Planctomycetota bacterium]